MGEFIGEQTNHDQEISGYHQQYGDVWYMVGIYIYNRETHMYMYIYMYMYMYMYMYVYIYIHTHMVQSVDAKGCTVALWWQFLQVVSDRNNPALYGM